MIRMRWTLWPLKQLKKLTHFLWKMRNSGNDYISMCVTKSRMAHLVKDRHINITMGIACILDAFESSQFYNLCLRGWGGSEWWLSLWLGSTRMVKANEAAYEKIECGIKWASHKEIISSINAHHTFIRHQQWKRRMRMLMVIHRIRFLLARDEMSEHL